MGKLITTFMARRAAQLRAEKEKQDRECVQDQLRWMATNVLDTQEMRDIDECFTPYVPDDSSK